MWVKSFLQVGPKDEEGMFLKVSTFGLMIRLLYLKITKESTPLDSFQFRAHAFWYFCLQNSFSSPFLT